MHKTLFIVGIATLLLTTVAVVLFASPSLNPNTASPPPTVPLQPAPWQISLDQLREELHGEIAPCAPSLCPTDAQWLTYRNNKLGMEISFPYDFWVPSEVATAENRLHFMLGAPYGSPFFFRTIQVLTPDRADPFHGLFTREWLSPSLEKKLPGEVLERIVPRDRITPEIVELNGSEVLYIPRALRYTEGLVEGRALYSPSNNLVVWTTDVLLGSPEGRNEEAAENITAILGTIRFFPPD